MSATYHKPTLLGIANFNKTHIHLVIGKSPLFTCTNAVVAPARQNLELPTNSKPANGSILNTREDIYASGGQPLQEQLNEFRKSHAKEMPLELGTVVMTNSGSKILRNTYGITNTIFHAAFLSKGKHPENEYAYYVAATACIAKALQYNIGSITLPIDLSKHGELLFGEKTFLSIEAIMRTLHKFRLNNGGKESGLHEIKLFIPNYVDPALVCDAKAAFCSLLAGYLPKETLKN